MLALAASTSAALSNAELYQRVALEKERSFAILANIADGIVAVDREGRVVLWNEAAEQITGVPAGDALGQRARRGAAGHARVGQRHARRRPARLDHARPRGGVALGDGSGDARSGRQRQRPHLRVPRHLLRPARRADEVRLRLDGVARAAHAAHVDLRLRRDAAAPGRPVRRRGAPDVPRLHRVGVAATHGDRRRAARTSRVSTPATSRCGSPRPTCSASSTSSCTTSRRAARTGTTSCSTRKEESLAANADRDKLRQVCSILLDNALKYSPAGGTVTVGIERKQRHRRGERRRRGDRHPAGRPGSDLPQVLPRRRRRVARRRERHRPRPLHRPRPRDRDGREDLGRIARRRGIDVRLRASGRRSDGGSLGI